MSDRREITIGALRLAGEPCDCVGDPCTLVVVSINDGDVFRVHRTEWQSLLAVSALIEAAGEWRGHQDYSTDDDVDRELMAAIDSLATSSRRSK